MPRLVINPNTGSAWEAQLKPGANLFGRGFANDFKIENPSVSSSHCQIILEGGRVTIKDLGSTNGTFVNRSPVTEAVLQPGQTIHLGNVEILFQGDASAPAMPPPVPGFAPAPPRAMTPVSAPSLQAAEGISIPPPPTGVPAPAAMAASAPPPAPIPPRPAGMSLAPRTAAAGRAVPAAVAAAAAAAKPAVSLGAAPAAASPIGGHAVVGGGNCKFHPRTMGRYLCDACKHYFCDLCVASRQEGPGVKFCRQCGAELTPVQVKVVYNAPKGFFPQIPGAFIYPVKGFGPLIIIISAILLMGLSFFSPGVVKYGYLPETPNWTLVFRLLAMGFLFAFMQSVIHATAIGDDEMPGLPSMSNFWEDILLPGLQFLGLTLICFGPAIGIMAFSIYGPGGTGLPIFLLMAALVFGVIYFPMAFLAVAMLDSVMAANPIQIVPSIIRVPLEYFVTCLVLGIVVALPPIGDFLIALMFPLALHTSDMGPMFGYLAALVFWKLFGLYLLVVGVRILGLLFRCKREKLGWLE